MKLKRNFMRLYAKIASVDDMQRAADFLRMILHLAFGDGSNRVCLDSFISPTNKCWSDVKSKKDLIHLTTILVSFFAIRAEENEDGMIMATVLDGAPIFFNFVESLNKKHNELTEKEIDHYYTRSNFLQK